MKASTICGVGLMLFTLVMIPVASLFWLEELNFSFAFLSIWFALMWGISVLLSPSYFWSVVNAQTGTLIRGQMISAVCAPIATMIFLQYLSFETVAIAILLARVGSDAYIARYARPDGWMYSRKVFWSFEKEK